MFAGKTGTYQVFHSRVGSWTKLEKLSTDKHSSLLQIFVNYGHKIFDKIGPEKTNESTGNRKFHFFCKS
jgi:hypothetical protein